MARTDLEKRSANAVDPQDEPSADWGWHGQFRLGTRIAAWFSAAAMFFMLIGNHTGRTEDVWLIVVGVGIVGVLVWDIIRSRTAWRR